MKKYTLLYRDYKQDFKLIIASRYINPDRVLSYAINELDYEVITEFDDLYEIFLHMIDLVVVTADNRLTMDVYPTTVISKIYNLEQSELHLLYTIEDENSAKL